MRAAVVRSAVALAAAVGVVGCGASERSSPRAEPDALIAPGESLFLRGEFDSARSIWRTALAAPGVTGTPTEARLLTWLGVAEFRLGDYPAARRLGEAGLERKMALGLGADIPQAQNALGNLAWYEGRLADASRLLQEALAGFQRSGDPAGIARASNNLGLVRYELGRFDEARAAFIIARDTARALRDARIEGRVLSNLGMLEIWAGDPHRALELLAAARARAEEVGDVVGISSALGQTGMAYSVLGEPGLALAALDSAIAVARRNAMREEESNNLIVMAGIYAEAGAPERALRMYADARRINEELGLTIEAGTVLREEALVRAERGALEAARRDAVEALALHRRVGARRDEFRDLLVLAEIDRRLERPREAERSVAEARRLGEALGSGQARLALALAEARITDDAGDAARALRVLDAVDPDVAVGGPGAEAEAHALRMRAWAALDRLDSAEVAGRRAVAAIERVRDGFAFGPLRTAYIADRSRVYADLVVVLLRQGATEAAFVVADAARGRAILEHLGSARADARRGLGLADLAEAERLLRRIDRLLAQLASEEAVPPQERGPAYAANAEELLLHLAAARRDYETLLARAAERDAARARMIGALPASSSDVRNALAADEAVLEYLMAEDRLFIFVVTPGGIQVIDQPVGHDRLSHQVRLARELLGAPDGGEPDAVIEALHARLIAPVAAAGVLDRVRHVFIVPHGALAHLPFAVLRDAATGRFLADDVAVSYLPTAAALPLLRARRQGAQSRARGFAPFPDRLPSTRAEVEAFRRAVPHARTMTGRRATEATLRAALAEGGTVHVASHAVMNARNPLFSRIEMARGRSGSADDGRLEIHELLELEISSPLVFLSGCQTALGSAWTTAFDQGEDYVTLAQAFLLAGAGNVVATLWRIDDEGAAAFATHFYGHLRTLSAPEALAAAQRDMRNDPRWHTPYYWAAYTLSGAAPSAAAQTPAGVAVKQE